MALFGLSTLSLLLPRVWQDAGNRRRSAYLALSVLVPLGILDATYMLSRWEPFTDHIETSLDRIIAQQVPVAQFFLAVVLLSACSAWRRGLHTRSVVSSENDARTGLPQTVGRTAD